LDNNEISQKWPEIKSKILAEHPDITEEELRAEIGREGEVLEKLQAKLGKNWTEVKNWLSLMG
jgi:hypothetical protein